jgi:hypothetical protein
LPKSASHAAAVIVPTISVIFSKPPGLNTGSLI